MDQMLILHLQPKDEWPGADGPPVPGYEPDPAEVAQWVTDEMTDATKHDGRIGWRLVAVVTTAPLSDLITNWRTRADIDQARALRLGAQFASLQLAGEAAARRACASELRKAAGFND